MGLINATIRVAMLNSQKLDLEYKIMLISQTQMNLSQSVQDLMQVGTDYTDPESPVVKMLNQRQAKLQQLEKRLQMQMAQYQTRLKMIETELESAKGMRDKNIQAAFRY
ncbi:hypothetical protein IJZ97_01800 [bacterium]|nr:hypothetical protein [bacterium]